jgi:hypothetical protein
MRSKSLANNDASRPPVPIEIKISLQTKKFFILAQQLKMNNMPELL